MKTNLINTPVENQSDNTEFQYFRLAASASNGRVKVYGTTLTEMCHAHYEEIKQTRNLFSKAREQERYARFLLDNFSSFGDKRSIAALAESLITDAHLNLAASGRKRSETRPLIEMLHTTAKRLSALRAQYLMP